MSTEDGRILAEYLARQFTNIRNEFDYPKVGRVGLGLENPIATTTLLTQTPIKVTGFDQKISPELSGEADITNSTIKLLRSGIWLLSVKGIATIVAHTANFTRGFAVELYNETLNQTYKVIDYSSIARYDETIDYTIAMPLFVPIDVLGNEMALYAYSTTTNDIQFTQLQILDFRFILMDTLLFSEAR